MPAGMDERELDRLLSAYCDEAASPEEIAWLDEAIQRDDRVRQLYLEYFAMHGEIARQLAEPSAAKEASQVDLAAVFAASPAPAPMTAPRGAPSLSRALHWRHHPFRFLAASAVLTLWMWSVWSVALIPKHRAERSRAAESTAAPASARLVRVGDAVWSNGAASFRQGAVMPPGTLLALDRGVVELRFASGAKVLLSGPARFRLRGANSAQLQVGRLSAHVPPPARGFLIHTEQAAVIDLGTDFDLEVDSDDRLRLSVFTGRVEVQPHAVAAADSPVTTRVVSAGEALEVLPSGATAPSAWRAERLVKRLPASDTTQLLAHYRLGENDPAAEVGSLAASITRDAVGNHPLTRRGAPRYAAGRSATQQLCVEFLGKDSAYVGPLRPEVANDWILDAWVRADTVDGIGIVVYHGDSYRNGYGIARMGDYWAGLFGGVGVLKFGAPVVVGRWTHLTLTRFAGATRLYVDGMQVGQLNRTTPNAPKGSLMIGGNAQIDGQAFGGQIDEVRLLKPVAEAHPNP